MNAEDIRVYALQKENVTEGFPFGEDTLVFKVNNKMFLLVALANVPFSINVKCDPDKAIQLREEYANKILPGYHMNKRHWNTILAESIKSDLVKGMIDDSYELVR